MFGSNRRRAARLVSHSSRGRATKLLTDYFRNVYWAAGLRWDTRNDEKMEELVDSIIEATKEELRLEEGL